MSEFKLICGHDHAYDLYLEDKRVGGVTLKTSLDDRSRPTILYISDFIIVPFYRGRGFAKQMLKEIAKVAKLKQCNKLKLMVHETNSFAMKIYEKAGFQWIGTREKYRVYEKGI